MSTFAAATVQDLKRLLELFPIARLREAWPEIKGTKEELCFAAATGRDYSRIAEFVDRKFCCCRQHVYAFTRPEGLKHLPDALFGEPAIAGSESSGFLYVLRVSYHVVLRDPLEEASIEFLWPIRLELTADQVNLVLRFVVLEKSVTPYFDRPCYVADRSVEEKSVLLEIESIAPERTDLHKGVKQLWAEGFMDSSYAKVKKALSMASETMDEEKGIKKHYPELYETIQGSTLLNALFAISEVKSGVSVFSVQPSNGYLAFPRYSEEGGTDFVIREILRNNQ